MPRSEPLEIRHAWTLPAPPGRVWEALTEPAELSRWYARCATVELRPGGRYAVSGEALPGAPDADGPAPRVQEALPGARLVLAWTVLGVPSTVRWSLEAREWTPFVVGSAPPRYAPRPGTHLVVTQELERAPEVERPADLLEDHWRLAFGNLFGHLFGAPVVLPDHRAGASTRITLERELAAPPERVWRALSEPAELERWLAVRARVDLGQGGGYDLGWGEAPADGSWPFPLREAEPGRLLTLEWPDWRGRPGVPATLARFELEAAGAGTRLVLRHGPFPRPTDRSDYLQGWWDFLEGLAAVVEAPPAPAGDQKSGPGGAPEARPC
jgi:uncharacterized protein YndB with AHSA1/START domain